jgi:Tol biopolymer transport system component
MKQPLVRIALLVSSAALALTLAGSGTALATYSGTNGRIAFARDPGTAGSNQDIWAMGPGGENPAPLTSTPEDEGYPSYSPDGERIVFTRGGAGSQGLGQVWVMNADGTGQIQITHGDALATSPVFSPDGTRIVYVSEFQAWVMNADGTNQKQLTFPGPDGDSFDFPEFSPDGKKIVLTRRYGASGKHGISVMNADGSGLTPLTTPSGTIEDYAPSFSPDGTRIVFDRYDQVQDDLFTMNADGSQATPLTSGEDDNDLLPVYSPDGTKVLFDRFDSGYLFSNITLVDSTGLDHNIDPLTTDADPVVDYGPAWQPLNPPACELGGKPASKSLRKVKVTVSCATENASVTVKGAGKAPKPRARQLAAKKASKFKIHAVTTQVAAGATAKVRLKVSKKGTKVLKRALAAGKKSKATITATFTDDLGSSATDKLKVKFKHK